jgi:serine phosphatase RsbU (regulator of sigma subunit)
VRAAVTRLSAPCLLVLEHLRRMSPPTGSELPDPPRAQDAGTPEHVSATVVAAVGASLDALGIGYAQLDAEWTIAHVNATGEAITSSAPGALVGRNHWDVFPAMAGTEFERNYHQAVDTGRPVVFRAFYPAPLDVWVEIRAVPRNGVLDVYFSDVTDQVAAEDDARAGATRLTLLAGINADLIATADVPATVAGLAPRLIPLLADGAMITLLDRSGLRRDVSLAHRDARLETALREYVDARPNAVPVDSPLGQVLASGESMRSSAAYVAATVAGAVRNNLLALGDSWTLHLPIRARTEVLGVLSLFFATNRQPDTAEELTLVEIASRIAQALENARLVGAQTQLAEGLQRSLLTDPPEPDHGQIVVRYLPAAEAARVGGDWYDAFVQRAGTTMLVIGDVAGHDTEAAATMGQLRGLLRGIATYSGAGPAEVLRGLDASMEVLLVGQIATAAVVRFEQTPEEREHGSTRMVWSSAGHPAPILVHADGRVEVLGDQRGELLLGVSPRTVRTERTSVLDRDATVLLYTDGLVERRGSDLDEGTSRLVSLIGDLSSRGADLDELCDGLLRGMVEDRPEDDVAIIAVRLHRQDRPRPAEAGPERVPDSVPPTKGPVTAQTVAGRVPV